jgi:hypothetical protein
MIHLSASATSRLEIGQKLARSPFERERFTSRLPSQFPTQFASPLGILPFCATASLCRAFLQRM